MAIIQHPRSQFLLRSFGGAAALAESETASKWGKPEIFNSDQGSQYTSREFVDSLENLGISISQDGRGRVFDNIFIERLWRSVKYEEVYLKDYQTVAVSLRECGCTALDNLTNYFEFYNYRRLHQSLDYQCPATIHFNA